MTDTCASCKYLGKGRAEFDSEYTVRLSSIFFECNLIRFHCQYDKRVQEDKLQAYVIDGSDYAATLMVRKTFGCNQWVSKEQP